MTQRTSLSCSRPRSGPRRSAASAAAAVLSLPVVALALSSMPAAGQSARDIMNRALDAYEARIEGVENYTVTQEVMGFTTTSYFVKREVDGHPVFTQATGGDSARAPQGWGNPYRLFPTLAGRAQLQGRTEQDGNPTWALAVEDFSGLDIDEMAPSGIRGDFRPERAVFYLDTENYAIRRLVLDGQIVSDTATQPMRMDARFTDYREVKGLLHPYRVDIDIRGMKAVMSEQDLNQARRQLEQLRSQLESMPEERRKMVREMLGRRLEQLERMVESGDAAITVRVQELKVNEGPPETDSGGGGSPGGSGG